MRQYWLIGPTIGNDLSYIGINSYEFCAEEFVNTTWSENAFISNEWTLVQSKTVLIQCLDGIYCSCQNLDFSGMKSNYLANGHFVLTISTIDGRKCYIGKFMVVIHYTIYILY